MKIILYMAVISVFALDSLGTPLSEEAAREAELRSAVQAFGRAYVEADVSELGHLLTENYVHVNGSTGNVLGREDWLEWVGSRRAAIESGELRVVEYRIEDIQIVSHDTTAIVVGTVYSSQLTGDVSGTSRVRVSNTWLYRNEKWLRASFHDSPIS